MKVTLVTASFNDMVHGTVNDKKTGCGINLMKPDNASRYHKSGEMSYLGELTCEKCKTKIAKEMIKADSKEMKALLKEERMRAKKGLDDEGLVELSTLEVRPTSVAVPEPEPIEPEHPEIPVENVQVNADNPAYTDDLAQFAIKKPQQYEEEQPVQEEPKEEDFLAQFSINKPQETPAPVQEEPEEEDFLAQFSINKPQEAPAPAKEEPEEEDFLAQFAINKSEEVPASVQEEPEEEDFLAQFSVSSSESDKSYENEEPELPPVIDDISDALSSIQNNPLTSLHKDSEPQELDDDILSMFSIDKTDEVSAEEDSYETSSIIDDDDYDDESIFDAMTSYDDESFLSNANEWDVIANQLFGDMPYEEPAPVLEEISVPEIDDIKAPEPEEISAPVLEDIKAPEPEEISAPVLEDIKAPELEEISAPEIDDIKAPEPEEISAPVLEDIKAPELEEISAPEIDDIKAPELEEISAPVLEDIKAPELEEISAPVLEDIAEPEPEEISAPVLDDIKAPELEEISAPVLEDIAEPESEKISAPVLDDIKAPEPEEISAPAIEEPVTTESVTPPPVQPVQQPVTPPPVQQVQQPFTPPPVQPVQQPFTPPPVQQVQQPFTPPPVQPMNAPNGMGIGQIVTVPQITGYDQNRQPVYAYMQMLFQGYDPNGQPIMMPLPAQNIMGMGMGIPVPSMPVPPVQPVQQSQPDYSSLNKNSRLQAVLDSLDEPVSEKEMTIGQKIAAAEAAKGSPVTANVSKIATNPHAKSTSQAFISAISESKEATQSLTETQGLKPKTMVLDSIEDVLSQLGDNSLKEKKESEAKMKKNVPVYEEFKAPSRTSSSSFSRPVPSSSQPSSNMMDIPLTKAQQKELKKQQKIDEKFRKKMEKNK